MTIPIGYPISQTVNVYATWGTPMILPSSGSIGNNGALTLTTALPATFSTGCYMYFPASAIQAGSAAGVYYVVMSSTTVGVIYNNTYTSGVPTPPTSPTAFATTGPGAYTQTTGADQTFFSLSIPGGLLGSAGKIRIFEHIAWPNNANAKNFKYKAAGSTLAGGNVTTNVSLASQFTFSNLNSQAFNFSTNSTNGDFAIGGGATYSTVDTSAAWTLAVTAQMAIATDYVIFTDGMIEVYSSS